MYGSDLKLNRYFDQALDSKAKLLAFYKISIDVLKNSNQDHENYLDDYERFFIKFQKQIFKVSDKVNDIKFISNQEFIRLYKYTKKSLNTNKVLKTIWKKYSLDHFKNYKFILNTIDTYLIDMENQDFINLTDNEMDDYYSLLKLENAFLDKFERLNRFQESILKIS